MRRNAADEFREYADNEAKRLRNSDQEFDAEFYQQAVDLVLHKLQHIDGKAKL
jgi:hypothetical protein